MSNTITRITFIIHRIKEYLIGVIKYRKTTFIIQRDNYLTINKLNGNILYFWKSYLFPTETIWQHKRYKPPLCNYYTQRYKKFIFICGQNNKNAKNSSLLTLAELKDYSAN